MSDETKIQTFDPEALKKRIAESVQSTFGMLIPADQWSALIEREVKAFFEEPTSPFSITEEKVRSSYSGDHVVSHHLTAKLTPFRALVWKACSTLCIAEIEKALTGDTLKVIVEKEWKYQPNGSGGHEAIKEVVFGEIIGKKLEEIAPKMVASLFRDMFVAAAQNAKYELVAEMQKAAHR